MSNYGQLNTQTYSLKGNQMCSRTIIRAESIDQRRLLLYMKFDRPVKGATTVYCNNQSAIATHFALASNNVHHPRNKHVDVRWSLHEGSPRERGNKCNVYSYLWHGNGFLNQSLAKSKTPELRGSIELENFIDSRLRRSVGMWINDKNRQDK